MPPPRQTMGSMAYYVKFLINWFRQPHDPRAVAARFKMVFASVHSQRQSQHLKIENVDKVYDNGVKAINDLSLEIDPGMFVVLLGPSGCGKTTLLRMIAGLESISAGYIKFNDVIINSMPPKDREIAMVFQNYALFPFMSVYKNIEFGLKNKIRSNRVYQNLNEDLKIAKNPYHQQMKDNNTRIKLLTTPPGALLDEKLRCKRLIAINIKKSFHHDIKKAQRMVAKAADDTTKTYFQKAVGRFQDLEQQRISNIKKYTQQFNKIQAQIRAFTTSATPPSALLDEKLRCKRLIAINIKKSFHHDIKKAQRMVAKAADGTTKTYFRKAVGRFQDLEQQRISNIKKYTQQFNKIQAQIRAFTTSANQTATLVKKLQTANQELRSKYKIYCHANDDRKARIHQIRRDKYDAAKLWKDNIPNLINDVTTMLGINLHTRRKPSELSGGQRQRVALGRAISKQTGLYLFDEPLSNLDAKLRAKMRTEIRKIHDNLGATSIYVTHDQVEAMSMADKVVVMNQGYIQQVGAPLELLSQPQNLFVAKFIGNTEINIFKVQYVAGTKFKLDRGGVVELTKFKDFVSIKQLQQAIVMGIRPEHIIVNRQVVSVMTKNKFVGTVISKELLGNDVVLDLKSPQIGVLQALAGISQDFKIGDKIDFVINPNRAFIYDYKTGFNLLIAYNDENKRAREVWIAGKEERRKNIYLMNKQKHKMSFSGLMRTYLFAILFKSAKNKLRDRKVLITYENLDKAT